MMYHKVPFHLCSKSLCSVYHVSFLMKYSFTCVQGHLVQIYQLHKEVLRKLHKKIVH